MTALYIVAERKASGFDTYVDGHALSAADAELTKLAETLDVAPLMEFFSMDPEEALAQAEEFNTGLTRESIPDEKWFPAADGLKTVRALLRHLDENPEAVPSAPSVANELAGFENVLKEAERLGIRWHLAVDY